MLFLLPFVHILYNYPIFRKVFALLSSESNLWKFLSAKTNSQTCHFLRNLFLAANRLTDWVYLHFHSVITQNRPLTLLLV